ncbi:hypothetical protein Tco_0994761 [Tanacetum coccineum]
MDNTRAQQKALDDELVAPVDRLKIGKSNLRLSSILKSKEPSLQVALDALKLTPFYNAFEISADVPEIYMQEFWVIVSRHHSSLRFKLNGKSHTVNVDNFRDIHKICPKLPDYFMAKDQGIPQRNKMFWHYARDDFMFTTVRVISKHQDTQVYGAILPQHLTDQAMLESKAYMTYRAYATGEKTPKPKTIKKKVDSESSPKTKSTQASKGKRIMTLAKGDKPAKKKQSATKSKGLTVLSESKVPDEQQQNISGTNEGAGDKPEVPDVPEYRSESKEESWTYSQGEDDEDNDEHDSENDNDDEDDDQENVSGETESDNDEDDFVHPNLSTYKVDDQEEEKEEEKANDDEDVSSDQMVSTPPDYEITEEEENQEDDDNVMGGEQEDEEDEELYGDLNLNLERRDAEMMDAQVNQEKEEVHVTFTTELPVVQQQSSFVSSDLVSKFINPTPDTSIDSILNPNIQFDIPVYVSVSVTTTTPSSDTTIPQTPILIIQPQQQIHDSTTTTTIPATTLPNIPNFSSLFSFERRVSSLETKFKDENPSFGFKQGTKRKGSGKGRVLKKESTQLEYKLQVLPNGASSLTKSSGKSAQAEEYGPRVDDLEEPLHQEFNIRNDDVSPVRKIIAIDERLWNPSGSQTPNREWNKTKAVVRPTSLIHGYEGLLITVMLNRLKTKFLEVYGVWHKLSTTNMPTWEHYWDLKHQEILWICYQHAADYGHIKWIEDKVPRSIWIPTQVVYDKHAYWGTYHWGPKRKLTNLNLDERFALNVALRMYTRRIVIQERVEDLQLAVESYQKKINLSRPDSYHDMERNHLMRTDELHKFSDGTQNHVRTALNDIATGIQMEYLPKRKWTKQDK